MTKAKLTPKNLIIIGNGNERTYKIKTSYNDFKEWIEKKLSADLDVLVEDLLASIESIQKSRGKEFIGFNPNPNILNDNYTKIQEYSSLSEDTNMLEQIAVSLWKVSSGHNINSVDLAYIECVDFEIFDNLSLKNNQQKYILLYFYSVFVNISKEKSVDDIEDLNWGDIELQLADLFEITASSTSENMELNRQFILDNFKKFKKLFTEFIENTYKEYKCNHLDNLSSTLNKVYDKVSELENEFAILDFNYHSRYDFCKNSVNYIFVHGSLEDNEKIVFGANFSSTEYDELMYLLDKKHQVLLYNISKDKVIDYSNIENVYTFGFGFSKNDEYFIHGLLAHNTKVQFNIIQYENEKKYSSDQLSNLYEIIGGYEHDKSLLSRKVVCNQIKILRSADFRDGFYNE